MFLHGLDLGIINNNYFLHNTNTNIANSYAVDFDFSSGNNLINFHDNVVHGIYTGGSNALIRVTNSDGSELIEFNDNMITSTLFPNVLIELSTEDAFSSPSNNQYFSIRETESWFTVFDIDYDFLGWENLVGESGSINSQPQFCDDTRNIESYQISIGGDPKITSFIVEAKTQGKFHWNNEYDVNTVNNWIRDGFKTCN